MTGADRRLSSAGHFLANLLPLFATQGVSWMGGLVLTIVMPRFLGDANLGRFAFAFALVGLVGLVPNLGTSTWLAKAIAQEPDRAGDLTARVVTIRLPVAMVVATGTVFAAQALVHDLITQRTIDVFCLVMVVMSVDLTATLQGLHRMRVIGLANAAANLSYAGFGSLVLLTGGGPSRLALVYVLSQAAGQAVMAAVVLRSLRLAWRPTRGSLWLVVAGGLPFFVWQAALVIYGQIDQVMLGFLSPDRVVGWYAAAYRIVSVPAFIPVLLTIVAYPALAATTRDAVAFNAIARRSLQVVAVALVPVALVIGLFPGHVLHLLGYPDVFQNARIPIVLLALHVPLVGVDMIVGTVLNARNRQLQWAVAAVAAAVLNPLLNLVAIPYTQRALGNGAVGAAAVTTLTELFLMVVGFALAPRGVFGRWTLGKGARIVLVAALSGLVAWPLRSLPFVAAVACLGAVYAALSLLAGAVTIADCRALLKEALGRLRPAAASA
ncbi:MAG: oligosaccharide flippase family protein [Candidatus Dormibacteraeota bacterium]|nr:oligosaccharide flippase family protein [Candidatus Dormibacteraeota bacterium]